MIIDPITDVNDANNKQSTDDKVATDDESNSIWIRLIYMLLVIIIYSATRVVVAAIMLVQFITKLFRGEVNKSLLDFSESLSVYTLEIVRYLTFVTERRPYPFDRQWPQASIRKD